MRRIYSTVLLCLLSLTLASGCTKKTETEVDATTSVPADATVNAIEDVAADKEKLRQTLIVADTKGTLLAALTEASQDSVIRNTLRAALAASASVVQAETNTNAAAKPAAKRSTATNSRSTTNAPAKSKDGLDQASDAIDDVNRTIDRTTTVVDKAAEARRKADELLRGKK